MMFIALFLACVRPVSPAITPGAEAPVTERPCLMRIEAGKSGGVLQEQRALAAPWRDFATVYPRATIDPAQDLAVKVVSDVVVGGRPLLWFDPTRTIARVDGERFGSDISVVDATSLQAGQEQVIGVVEPSARAELGPRGLASFLVRSDTVRIYAHIEGYVCLEREATDESGWRGWFRGEHTYFTNDENHAAMAFELRLEAAGAMRIIGG